MIYGPERMSTMVASREIGVAVLGLGTIGSAVASRIQQQGADLERAAGLSLQLRAVLERGPERAERAGLSPDVIVTDFADVLANPDVHVVVEVLGGEQPAAQYIEQALQSGRHVVTANKEALSKHFDRLVRAALESKRALLFEASVGGGIPLLVSFRQMLAANRVTAVRGIVNGTTNYILSQMTENGAAYDDALAEAQRLGYAEPDPTADVEGFDSAYKVAILASLMTGAHVHPDSVNRTGITRVSPDDIAAARADGSVIKLIASAERSDDGVEVRVAPAVVPVTNLLAHVRANYNAVEITGDQTGPIVLSGQGAGPRPTAAAIVSDIVEAARSGAAANPRWGDGLV
jgi:homoserine dehydrogenase